MRPSRCSVRDSKAREVGAAWVVKVEAGSEPPHGISGTVSRVSARGDGSRSGERSQIRHRLPAADPNQYWRAGAPWGSWRCPSASPPPGGGGPDLRGADGRDGGGAGEPAAGGAGGGGVRRQRADGGPCRPPVPAERGASQPERIRGPHRGISEYRDPRPGSESMGGSVKARLDAISCGRPAHQTEGGTVQNFRPLHPNR